MARARAVDMKPPAWDRPPREVRQRLHRTCDRQTRSDHRRHPARPAHAKTSAESSCLEESVDDRDAATPRRRRDRPPASGSLRHAHGPDRTARPNHGVDGSHRCVERLVAAFALRAGAAAAEDAHPALGGMNAAMPARRPSTLRAPREFWADERVLTGSARIVARRRARSGQIGKPTSRVLIRIGPLGDSTPTSLPCAPWTPTSAMPRP